MDNSYYSGGPSCRLETRLPAQRPRRARLIPPNLALRPQLLQDLQHAPLRRLPQALGIVLVNDLDELPARPAGVAWRLRGHDVENLLLALLAMLQVFPDSGGAVGDDGPVAGVGAAAKGVGHGFEAMQVGGEVFEDGGALAEDVVGGEHGVFFFEDEGHVVGGVAGGVQGAQRCALGLELLPVADVEPVITGIVLMYGGVGRKRPEVWHALDMVGVPVR